LTRASGAGLGLGRGVNVGNGSGVAVALVRAGAGVFPVILGVTLVALLHARVRKRNIKLIRGILFIICATITQERRCVNCV
jgi:hypothetical protein